MGGFTLNLSTQPFRSYQVRTLLLTAALILLVAVSAWQGYGFLKYQSMSNRIRGQAEAAQVESEALGRRLAQSESKLSRPEAAAKLNEIEFLNNIIARKTFSWSEMFANLEKIMPDNVYLVSLTPEVSKSGVLLRMDLSGRSIDDIKQLIDALQASPLFGKVFVPFDQKKDPGTSNLQANPASSDVNVDLRVTYHPEREGQ